MADIAAAAGVSRQTLYKEFGSREEFARALIVREGDRFVAAVEGAMDAHLADPTAALLAAFALFLTVAAEDPLVRPAIAGADEMLPLVTTQGQPLVEHSTERLQAAISSRWEQVSPHDTALLSECLVRLAISYATLPAGPAGVTAAAMAAARPLHRPGPGGRFKKGARRILEPATGSAGAGEELGLGGAVTGARRGLCRGRLGAVERWGQQLPQRGAFLRVKRLEHLVLDRFLGALGARQRLMPLLGQLDQMPAPIERVAQALYVP